MKCSYRHFDPEEQCLCDSGKPWLSCHGKDGDGVTDPDNEAKYTATIQPDFNMTYFNRLICEAHKAKFERTGITMWDIEIVGE